jgi:hypothetical protein
MAPDYADGDCPVLGAEVSEWGEIAGEIDPVRPRNPFSAAKVGIFSAFN